MKEKKPFRSSMTLTTEEIKDVLLRKIAEETKKAELTGVAAGFDVAGINYVPGKINVLSLFSGCGGLDLGFELAGLTKAVGENKAFAIFRDRAEYFARRNESVVNIIYSNDIFPEANETYKNNFSPKIRADSTDIRKIAVFPAADLVLGGFPCPGFSEAGPRLIDDDRNFLYLHFIRCLWQAKPKVFVAENVKGMLTLGNGEVFKQIKQDFAAAGYTVRHKLLNAAFYNVPEVRERVILVGIRNDLPTDFSFPEEINGGGKAPILTLKDAVWDLKDNPGEYFRGDFSSIFMSRNRKKRWDEPSYTIQASGRQAPIHPGGAPMIKVGENRYAFADGQENNRRLSIKEIARIQTFPDWFSFSKGKSNRSDNAKIDLVYKQIGNAVPVMLAYYVALQVLKSFDNF